MKFEQARWVREEDNVYEPHLAEKDRSTVSTDDVSLPDEITRDEIELPELSEPELARHYTRLSEMTYGVENGPYPLGSCTMKYNPKFTEDLAAHPAGAVHPDRQEDTIQGNLEIMHTLQDYLARIGGMDAVTLQPPSGAAGEFTGIMIAKEYHRSNGDERSEVIVPDTAHGTNPATATMAGYDVVVIESNDEGCMDLEAVRNAVSEETAALMLTNPNTVGVFEDDIQEIADAIHDVGGLLYYDGANLNALMGRARPGDMDFDIMHYNVHKTFAAPHGGGGPGAGPVGVKEELADYLPKPHVRETEDGDYEFYEPDNTIGKVHGFHGNWPVLLKSFAYILRLGDEGLLDTGERAILNANYLASQIDFAIPYGPFFHEFVASAGEHHATDVAKRLLDAGVHPPTTAWPEIVDQALMTEPTEIESKDTLDQLAQAFNIAAEATEEELKASPQNTAARRIDQSSADRNPRLTWDAIEDIGVETPADD
ncbi:aminomethyl-transferring glycine dehydrogenase subunit GcvPB [Salinarchaeum sp. IM2453]|uniref:aminomethyl-transferring glycine dehydrogenase subunit GcvPB n=1 Tax=Salinarchaeum sp. IM2453 TaxID=2862870 RepID=UPI001C830C62|nr:aminomethyl-transferring glycine dehydrogenase subunit GcvPB [Salinarchaeum sp. IM2453]QZA89275.1 aminomethyl-transferring glycine dehydrogenase subunit GcvPB [Salinarchaeum sp. IM2453]